MSRGILKYKLVVDVYPGDVPLSTKLETLNTIFESKTSEYFPDMSFRWDPKMDELNMASIILVINGSVGPGDAQTLQTWSYNYITDLYNTLQDAGFDILDTPDFKVTQFASRTMVDAGDVYHKYLNSLWYTPQPKRARW